MNKRCECGCGERVNTGRRFVHGHNDRKIDIDRIHAYKKAGFRVLIVWDDVFNKDQKAQVARAEKAISAV